MFDTHTFHGVTIDIYYALCYYIDMPNNRWDFLF